MSLYVVCSEEEAKFASNKSTILRNLAEAICALIVSYHLRIISTTEDG